NASDAGVPAGADAVVRSAPGGAGAVHAVTIASRSAPIPGAIRRMADLHACREENGRPGLRAPRCGVGSARAQHMDREQPVGIRPGGDRLEAGALGEALEILDAVFAGVLGMDRLAL